MSDTLPIGEELRDTAPGHDVPSPAETHVTMIQHMSQRVLDMHELLVEDRLINTARHSTVMARLHELAALAAEERSAGLARQGDIMATLRAVEHSLQRYSSQMHEVHTDMRSVLDRLSAVEGRLARQDGRLEAVERPRLVPHEGHGQQ